MRKRSRAWHWIRNSAARSARDVYYRSRPAWCLRRPPSGEQHALLSGDALVVAVMHERGFTHLASHDADFDRVPGLTRYAPA